MDFGEVPCTVKKFCDASYEDKITLGRDKENIPEKWKGLFKHNYVNYSNTAIIAANTREKHYILTLTRKGKIIRSFIDLSSLLH